jgi:hypothetical protein
MGTSTIPGNAVDKTATDLIGPTQELLKSLNLLADVSASPDSAGVAVLESNAAAISKGWAAAVAGLGGLSTVVGAIAAFWSDQSNEVRLALISGIAFMIPITALAIAWIITSDLKSRAQGQIAIYQSRREIAMSMLQDSFIASSASATPTSPTTSSPVVPSTTAIGPGLSTAAAQIFSLAVLAPQTRVVLADPTTQEVKSGALVGYREREGTLQVAVQLDDGPVLFASPGSVRVEDTLLVFVTEASESDQGAGTSGRQ